MRIFKNIFWVGQIDFPISPKALKRRCFGQTFGAAGKFLKKQVKKPVLGTFWNILTKKTRFFFGPSSPSKLVYTGVKVAFRTFFESVGQKWIS